MIKYFDLKTFVLKRIRKTKKFEDIKKKTKVVNICMSKFEKREKIVTQYECKEYLSK